MLLGAHNETEQLLLKTLHAHNLPCYHHILGHLLPHFKNTSLEVATRMYLRPGACGPLVFRTFERCVSVLTVIPFRVWSEAVFCGGISGQVGWLNKNIFVLDENELKLGFVLTLYWGTNPGRSLWFLWKKSTTGLRTPPMGTSLTFWRVFPIMWCLCSWMLCILKVNDPPDDTKVPFEIPKGFLLTPRWMADTVWPYHDLQRSLLPGQHEICVSRHDDVFPVPFPVAPRSRTESAGKSAAVRSMWSLFWCRSYIFWKRGRTR